MSQRRLWYNLIKRMSSVKSKKPCWVVVSCVIVLSLSVHVTPAKMGHVESLSLKESVIRNHNGVMLMTLSPRKTVLSLSNARTNAYGQKPVTHKKPSVIYATAFPSQSSDSVDNETDEDLIANQTETVSNSNPSSSVEPAVSLTVENRGHYQQRKGNRNTQEDDDDKGVHYLPHEDHASSSSSTETENSSQLPRSALHNTSNNAFNDDSSGSFKLDEPENTQIWSSKEDLSTTIDFPFSDEEDSHQSLIVGFLQRDIWTIPLFVFASLNLVLISFFEIYVLCRTKGQSRRHLFLGQMLLFGLFLSSSLALLFAVYPSAIGCFIGRLGVGVSYSMIFAVLMVKCMFLLSLDVGVYLPATYQGCLLFFTVLVQVVIDTQRAIFFPPNVILEDVDAEGSLLLRCGTTYPQLLYSLGYNAFLMVIVSVLAIKATCNGITDNYREAIYILISILVSVPIAICWAVAGWILQGRHQDACISFGLVSTSLCIFLIMFMPKVGQGRQLAAMGKESVYVDDQEDQCSGYSPSFFHFKPSSKSCKTTIFGDGNLYTTLEPTLSTINPNVFFHRADYHSGMIY